MYRQQKSTHSGIFSNKYTETYESMCAIKIISDYFAFRRFRIDKMLQ